MKKYQFELTPEQAKLFHQIAENMRTTVRELVPALAMALLEQEPDCSGDYFNRALVDFGRRQNVPNYHVSQLSCHAILGYHPRGRKASHA